MEPCVKILKSHLKFRTTIVVGVSGGADSVYLLEQCRNLEKELKLKLVIAHINHGLRGKESDMDAIFVKNLAKKYRLIFEQIRLKSSQKTDKQRPSFNAEEQGRIERYKFFEKLRKKYHADWILTAHHLNDNIETAIFNLIRGANLNGLKGMQTTSIERYLLRPLLTTPKKHIVTYLKKHRLPYRTDQSNNNINFSRNWLRKKVIPLFQKINPNFEKTFQQNLQNLTETHRLIEKLSGEWLEKNWEKESFDLQKFLKEPLAMQKNILVQIYKKLYSSTNKLSIKHLEEVLKILHAKIPHRQKEFGTHYFLVLERGKRVALKKAKKSVK